MKKRPPPDPELLAARLGSPKLVKAARRAKTPERSRPGAADPRSSAAHPKAPKPPKSPKTPKTPTKAAVPKPRPVFRDRSGVAARLERAFEALPSPVRIRVLAVAVGVMLLAVWGRAAYLQLSEGHDFSSRAAAQSRGLSTIEGRRGRVLDRHGKELASTVPAVSIFAHREQIQDREDAVARLSPILGLDVRTLEQRLAGPRGFVFLSRRVDPEIGARVEAANVQGVGVQEEPRRVYGQVRLAAHVVGFVDGDGVGQIGVERQLQAQLRGRPIRIAGSRDARSNKAWTEGYGEDLGFAGRDVVLSLDAQLQFRAEEALQKAVEAQQARAGVVVAIDSKSGEILALASHPSFNPNHLGGSGPEDRTNRAIQTLFDPGSTAKIVTVAAALDANAATPDTLIDCEQGRWRVGNRTIRDANHRFGVMSVTKVFERSSNIGAGKLALMMGKETLHRYLQGFGFGAPTRIELPFEVKGILRDAAQWREVDLVNIAFGQGISVTPMQVAMAANVIAADGMWLSPRLVLGVRSPDGQLEPTEVPPPRRVIDAKTARAVTKMMVAVTGSEGSAPRAAVPGFAVAGKTGTAQKYDPELGAYSRERYVASFVGFVPAEDPVVTVLALIDEPKVAIYGGQVAAPVFAEVARAALVAKGRFPSHRPEVESTVRDDPSGSVPADDAERALERAVAELSGAAMARSEQARATPRSLEEALSPSARLLLGEPLPEPVAPTAAVQSKMPDLRGLELREALARCAQLGLEPRVEGVGERVRRQRPKPGARLLGPQRCALELGRDG